MSDVEKSGKDERDGFEFEALDYFDEETGSQDGGGDAVAEAFGPEHRDAGGAADRGGVDRHPIV